MPPDWRKRTATVEMSDWKRDGWEVLERAGHDAGTVTWRARHACGGIDIVKGTALRFRPPKWCRHCRPKRPGTVELHGRLRPRRRRSPRPEHDWQHDPKSLLGAVVALPSWGIVHYCPRCHVRRLTRPGGTVGYYANGKIIADAPAAGPRCITLESEPSTGARPGLEDR